MTQSPAPSFLEAVEEDGYVFPDYGGYCFASVPETLLSLFSERFDHRLPQRVFEGVDTEVTQVVVVLLDGLGWDQFHRDRQFAPLLDALGEGGSLTPLTSVYPSETAAAITTLHSGQTPAEHGLLGWFQFVTQYDAVLQTLPFTTLDDEPAIEVFEDADRSVLSDADPLYPRVADTDVGAHLYQPARFDANEPGATNHPYSNVADAAAQLRMDLDEAVTGDEGPAYRYLYVPEIDALAHAVGTDHDRYRAQVRMVTEAIRYELFDRLSEVAAEETLLVVTADHGHVDTDPATNVDLRETTVWDHVGEVPPVGSPRNVQLHVDDPETTAAAFHDEFGDDVRTFTREEYLDQELFGPGTCDTFRTRAPDLVAVHREKGVWWDADELDLVGMHGGLSRDEMFVPFGAANVGDVR